MTTQQTQPQAAAQMASAANSFLAGLTDEQKAGIKQQVPLGRYADPAEVAGAVTWLSGPDAGYVTGAVIPVDGGLGMGH